MEANEELQTYMESVWDLIQPTTRRSGIMTDVEFRGKVADAKKTIVEIIKKLENPPTQQVRIVGICAPDGTPLPVPSTSKAADYDPPDSTVKEEPTEPKPVVFYEDDALDDPEEDYYIFNLDPNIDRNKPPPPGTRIVGICAPDGTPLPLPSTSGASGLQGLASKTKPAKKKPVKFYWDDDNADDFYDDYAEYLKEINTKQKLRSLYRILFWLDFVSNGFNCDKQHLRHF